MTKLTPKQAKFVAEYLIDLNGTQAAIRAKYSLKTAKEQAARLLSKAHIQEAIQTGRSKVIERLEIKADDILRENLRLARSDLRRLFQSGQLLKPEEWPDDVAAAVSSIKVVTKNLGEGTVEYVSEIKLWDKGAALDRTFKHLGLYEKDNAQTKLSLIPDSVLDKLIDSLGG